MYDKVKNKIRQLLGIQKVPEKKQLHRERSGRNKVTVFTRKLLEYDVVSFDIFDTLVFRTVNKPTDIFMFAGQKLGLLNYATMRREMEISLRDRREKEFGSREVTLEEIYDAMERYCGVDAKRGMETELEAEFQFCIANPYMKEVFELLKNYGKTIIFVSDMYLPEETMKKLLKSCGYEGYDRLFVSCDYGFGKRSGKLYDHIAKTYLKGRSVIHVGDNPTVDVEMAKEHGWASAFYEDIRSRGGKYRPTLMSPCIGSVYQAMMNLKMQSGAFETPEEKERGYQYGYSCGGMLILGYVTWIHEQAVKEQMDKVLFIARDGWIMKKVYDFLYEDIPSEYIYLSRNAALKLSYDYNRYELLKQFVDRRQESEKPYTIREILLSMDLGEMTVDFQQAGINPETEIVTEDECKMVKEFLIDHSPRVAEIYERSLTAFQKYMEPILLGCRHVAAVDTGWRGTCPTALKYLIEQKWNKECKVTGMMMGSCKYKWNNTIPLIADESIRTYLFSPEHNDHLARYHYKNNLIHNTCVEFITTAPHPSVRGFHPGSEKGYEIEFEYPEQENYDLTEKIHQGIMDFVRDYKKYYANEAMLWKIPGMDAYWPLRYVMEKSFDSVIKKTFNSYVYNKYVGGLEGKRDMSTFADMCREEGV